MKDFKNLNDFFQPYLGDYLSVACSLVNQGFI